jgi:hypothetical protein
MMTHDDTEVWLVNTEYYAAIAKQLIEDPECSDDVKAVAQGIMYAMGQIKWQREEIERLKEQLATDSVERMEEALALHYKEPVRPVGEYCKAFEDWHKVLAEKVQSVDEQEEFRDVEYYRGIVEALSILLIPIKKSNFLARRIYGGEKLRTEKCPTHKGVWSGCAWPGSEDYNCECTSDGNVTGWLPAKDEVE